MKTKPIAGVTANLHVHLTHSEHGPWHSRTFRIQLKIGQFKALDLLDTPANRTSILDALSAILPAEECEHLTRALTEHPMPRSNQNPQLVSDDTPLSEIFDAVSVETP